MTFIIAVGQNELLTKNDIGEVPECHVTRITCEMRMMHSKKRDCIEEQGSHFFLLHKSVHKSSDLDETCLETW